MSLTVKVLQWITDKLSAISIFTISAMMLLAVFDVFLRSFFKTALLGATELIQIFNVGIILALGRGSLANQNVTVDFVMEKVPGLPRIVIELVMDIVNLALTVVIIITSYFLLQRSMQDHNSYSLLKIPEWPFIIMVILGFIGGAAAIIVMITDKLYKLKDSIQKNK